GRSQPRRQCIERGVAVADGFDIDSAIVQSLVRVIFRGEFRRRADALDLPARFESPGIGRGLVEDAELEARRSGVEDDRVVLHARHCFRRYRVACKPVRRAWAAITATPQLTILDRRLSARLVRMIGTRAPRTSPAASAFARNVSCLASIFPDSRSGTSRMSGSPATPDVMPFTFAASSPMGLSKALGP